MGIPELYFTRQYLPVHEEASIPLILEYSCFKDPCQRIQDVRTSVACPIPVSIYFSDIYGSVVLLFDRSVENLYVG